MSNETINKINEDGETALIWAASKGLENVCELLIPKMTDQSINQITNNGYTALTAAAGSSSENVCELLISKMTDRTINKINIHRETALTIAARNGLENVCELLIPRMTNQEAINQIDNNSNTVLTWAASSGLDKVCELLISKMSDKAINQINSRGYTALTLAANNGLEKVCKLLIIRMSSETINHVNYIGETALSLATKKGFKSICDLLISKFQKLANELNAKIANNVTINPKDKDIMEDAIKNISQRIKVLVNKTDKEQILTNMQELLNGKPTKVKIISIEDRIEKLIKQQDIDYNKLIEKINIFQKLANEVNNKIANIVIDSKNKSIMESTIKEIISKAQKFNDITKIEKITDIEKINASMKEFIFDEPTKLKLMVIEEQMKELIEQQNINDNTSSILGDYSTFG